MKNSFLEAHEESRKKFKEKYGCPDSIMQFMNEKTEHTDKINEGGIDKNIFRLGMMAMYYHLKQHPEQLNS